MIGCRDSGRRDLALRGGRVSDPAAGRLAYHVWIEGLRVVYAAVEREARARFRPGLAAETIAPLPARGPGSLWYWPATVAWAQGDTLACIGARHGRSKERVRQVIVRSLLDLARRDAPDLAAWIDAVAAACPR